MSWLSVIDYKVIVRSSSNEVLPLISWYLFPFFFFSALMDFVGQQGWLGGREMGAGWKEHVRLRGFMIVGC